MKPVYLFPILLFPYLAMAQAPEKNKDVEQIIITKKGTDDQRLNIVVDGENVTINGKPAGKDNEDITVKRRKIKDLAVLDDDFAGPGERRIIRRQMGTPQAPNKAMLGVVTRKTDTGVEIMNVTEGSAADEAGLKSGDLITEVERQKIGTPDELSEAIGDKKPGDDVNIGYTRDNKQRTAIAKLKKWEAPDAFNFEGLDMGNIPNFNVEEFRERMGELNNQGNGLNRQYRFMLPQSGGQKLGIKIQDVETGEGVKVIEVEKGSDADKSGIKEGDIITGVNDNAIKGTEDMRLNVLSARTKNNMNIKLNRDGKTRSVEVTFSKKIRTADL